MNITLKKVFEQFGQLSFEKRVDEKADLNFYNIFDSKYSPFLNKDEDGSCNSDNDMIRKAFLWNFCILSLINSELN